jgi:hypothetical protein
MRAILRVRKATKLAEGKDSTFRVGGRVVDLKKLERFIQRKGLQQDELSSVGNFELREWSHLPSSIVGGSCSGKATPEGIIRFTSPADALSPVPVGSGDGDPNYPPPPLPNLPSIESVLGGLSAPFLTLDDMGISVQRSSGPKRTSQTNAYPETPSGVSATGRDLIPGPATSQVLKTHSCCPVQSRWGLP